MSTIPSVIPTKNLNLRLVDRRDAPAISKLLTADISQWLAAWPYPYTTEMAEDRIQAMMSLNEQNDALAFVITLDPQDTVIGWIAVTRDPQERHRGALGYWIASAHHGKEYASESVRAILPIGFTSLHLAVIEAGAQPENTGSLAVMRKAGMQPAGERMVYAPSRARDERCLFYEARPAITPPNATSPSAMKSH
jgi:ribosomal-protein-alanine N-acetyltransferase